MTSPRRAYRNHVKTLTRRREWLGSRLSGYHGNNPSRHLAEFVAVSLALSFIEANSEAYVAHIENPKTATKEDS